MSSRSSRRTFLKTTAAVSAGASLLNLHRSLAYAVPRESKWANLFDGKSLDGWHKNAQKIGHGTGGTWRVEDGAITGEQDPPGSGNGGILLTDKKFGDFELLIDMKPDWGVCSGLFLRGNDRGQCFQMMVDYHDAGNVGHLYGEGTTGFNTRTFDTDGKYEGKKLVAITTSKHKSASDVGLIHSCTPMEWVKAWKLNDWNTARVRVEGKYPKISTWINGLKVCEFDGATATTPQYDKESIFKKLGGEGRIAVQVHGGGGWPNGAKCRWKNIKIRPL
ncbi:MAG TPA: DUF1080 domain-containing protein [Planctomycetes bacterium]|nr:DUF1080 domain-containing protein [Planctomycetota bacterium]